MELINERIRSYSGYNRVMIVPITQAGEVTVRFEKNRWYERP